MHYFLPAEEISVRAKPSPSRGLGEIRTISGEPKSFFSYLRRRSRYIKRPISVSVLYRSFYMGCGASPHIK
nr:MAG TPA: hypothetical protein [Inoviridae sp.]